MRREGRADVTGISVLTIFLMPRGFSTIWLLQLYQRSPSSPRSFVTRVTGWKGATGTHSTSSFPPVGTSILYLRTDEAGVQIPSFCLHQCGNWRTSFPLASRICQYSALTAWGPAMVQSSLSFFLLLRQVPSTLPGCDSHFCTNISGFASRDHPKAREFAKCC